MVLMGQHRGRERVGVGAGGAGAEIGTLEKGASGREPTDTIADSEQK